MCIRDSCRTDRHADTLIERLKQFCPAGGGQPHNANIAASPAPGLNHITMIGREARGQHIIDLGWRALEVFSQFVAAKFNRLLLILFILHQSLDKIFNRIAE